MKMQRATLHYYPNNGIGSVHLFDVCVWANHAPEARFKAQELMQREFADEISGMSCEFAPVIDTPGVCVPGKKNRRH